MLKFPKIIGRVQATATPSEIDLQISGLYRGHTNWKYPQCNEPQASSTFECTQKCGAARRRGQKSKNQLIIRCHPCTRGASCTKTCTKTCVYTQNRERQRAHRAIFSRSEKYWWETSFKEAAVPTNEVYNEAMSRWADHKYVDAKCGKYSTGTVLE